MPRAASSERRRATVRPAPTPTRDERLRIARRIDWRFLLPTPELGRVAVIGGTDAELQAALSALGPVTRLDDGDGQVDAGATFDTVIATGRIERVDLARAAAAVGAGGRLVLEIGGPLAGPLRDGRSSGVGAAVRFARGLEAGGFDPVRTWWTWPTHARAASWARTDDPVAVQAMVTRRFGSRVGSVAGGLAGRLAGGQAGRRLLGVGAPAVTIIAARGGAPGGIIERRLTTAGRDEETGGAGGLLVLTPRYRASAHVVGLAIARDGTVDRVVKVARLADDTTLEHEASILGAVGPTLGATGRCPALVDAPGLATEIGGGTWPVLVETGVEGSPLDPGVVRRDRDAAVRGIVALLAELPVRPGSARATPVGRRLTDALGRIRAIGDGSGDGSDGATVAGRELAALVERTARIVEPLGRANLPRVLEHGDPAHPNLLIRDDGSVAAVDWERGEADGLPLHDLTIALAYVAAAVRDAREATTQAAAFRDAMTGADPWAASALDGEARRTGIDLALRPALVVVAFARSVAWLAEHLEVAARPSAEADAGPGAIDGPADAVAWLAGDRSVALWRMALELAEAA
jgi:hypothetical protein